MIHILISTDSNLYQYVWRVVELGTRRLKRLNETNFSFYSEVFLPGVGRAVYRVGEEEVVWGGQRWAEEKPAGGFHTLLVVVALPWNKV